MTAATCGYESDSIILMTVFTYHVLYITLFKFKCIKDISKSVIYIA